MMNHLQTFPCPNCNEIINSEMTECKFCKVPLDPEIARHAAQTQEKVNQACSDASYTKSAALVMLTLVGVSLIPIVPLVYYGFC